MHYAQGRCININREKWELAYKVEESQEVDYRKGCPEPLKTFLQMPALAASAPSTVAAGGQLQWERLVPTHQVTGAQLCG